MVVRALRAGMRKPPAGGCVDGREQVYAACVLAVVAVAIGV